LIRFKRCLNERKPVKTPSKILLSKIALTLLLTGCSGPKTVYVPAGEPMRLAEPVKARVWVKTQDGLVKSKNRVPISEGWYVLPKP